MKQRERRKLLSLDRRARDDQRQFRAAERVYRRNGYDFDGWTYFEYDGRVLAPHQVLARVGEPCQ